jgi:uncharacterized protein YbjT (DUF2867 family)
MLLLIDKWRLHMGKILVTGATGNIGKFLVDKLVEDGHSVKAFTRNPEKANLNGNIEICKGDLTNKDEILQALTGVDKAFLLLANIPADPFIEVASQIGLKHLVFLSSYSVDINWKSKNNFIAKHHAEVESKIKSSGIPYTFLRPAGFMTTVYQWLGSIKTQGIAFLPYPDVSHSVIHSKDIALSAAEVLKNNSHIGKSYFLSGPELMTPREMVKQISDVIGKELSVVQPERQQTINMMSHNLPISIIESIIELLESSPKIIELSDNVRRLTHTRGITFKTWIEENKVFFL